MEMLVLGRLHDLMSREWIARPRRGESESIQYWMAAAIIGVERILRRCNNPGTFIRQGGLSP